MHEQIYEKLKEVARAGTVTYYSVNFQGNDPP